MPTASDATASALSARCSFTELSVDPALAATTRKIAAMASRPTSWPRSSQPDSAAMTGSRLSSTPKTCFGTRLSAANSSEYGTTDDSIAVPNASSKSHGVAIAAATPPNPSGSVSMPATRNATASPPVPGTEAPTRAPIRM